MILYRSAARGHSHPVEAIRVESDEPETIERALPLPPFIDGGWYWFDIVAGPRGTTLIEADWLAPTVPDQAVPDQAVPDQAVPDQAVPDQAVPAQLEAAAPGRPSTGVPTVNKPHDAVP